MEAVSKAKQRQAERIHFVVSLAIRAMILVGLIGALAGKNYFTAFVSFLSFVLTFLPSMIEKNYKISLPAEFEMVIVVFMYFSIFLGNVRGFYTLFWWWDIVLHTGSGLILGFIGFLMLFILHHAHKISARPGIMALFSFFFALGIGALWEIFEFSMDALFGTVMQRSGLPDTMSDLIVDALGALVVSVLGYIYLKGKKTFLVQRLISRFLQENPHMATAQAKKS